MAVEAVASLLGNFRQMAEQLIWTVREELQKWQKEKLNRIYCTIQVQVYYMYHNHQCIYS